MNIEIVSLENTPGLDEILCLENVGKWKKIRPVKAPWATLTPSLGDGSLIGYSKVASSNISCLEAQAGFFRLLMKGIFDPYVLWP